MDNAINTNSSYHSDTDGHQRGDRSRNKDYKGGISAARSKAIFSEESVKKASGPAVSNTYAAETMDVTNHYHF
nr:hypothetical protein 2 [Gorica betanecrovirus 1]